MPVSRIGIALILLCCLGLAAQPVHVFPYTVLSQPAGDMVYDSVSSRLLISIPASDTVYKNSIGYIDPGTAVLVRTYPIGDDPGPLAITQNGKYLYVGLNGTSNIKKFNIHQGIPVMTFSVGSDPFLGPMQASHISCRPGTDSVIAVSRVITGTSGSAGAAVFKNGQLLPNLVVQYSVTISQVSFQSPDLLYAFNNQTPDFNFYTLLVNSAGASLINSAGNLMNGFGTEFYIHGNEAVSDNGAAVDLSGPVPVALGAYSLSGAALHSKACFDPYLDLVCFAYKDPSCDTAIIERFHRSSFAAYDRLKIGGITGDVKRLITWGDSTNYAFCTNSDQLAIVGKRRVYTGVAAIDPAAPVSIYPNPVQQEVFIRCNEPFVAELFDATGRQLLSTSENKINTGQLGPGLYFISVRTAEGKTLLGRRIIKQ